MSEIDVAHMPLEAFTRNVSSSPRGTNIVYHKGFYAIGDRCALARRLYSDGRVTLVARRVKKNMLHYIAQVL